jgi:hypothetical protein
MLFFLVFAELQHRLDPQAALPDPLIFSVPFIQPVCFQAFTHSFVQRVTPIRFPFNHFRTLSIATEGVPPVAAPWISSPNALIHVLSFQALTNCKNFISFLFF